MTVSFLATKKDKPGSRLKRQEQSLPVLEVEAEVAVDSHFSKLACLLFLALSTR